MYAQDSRFWGRGSDSEDDSEDEVSDSEEEEESDASDSDSDSSDNDDAAGYVYSRVSKLAYRTALSQIIASIYYSF